MLPDPDDRHVLAAAIRADADVIVTCNLADFPAETLIKFDLEAQHPDDFLVGLIEADPDAVCAVVKLQRESLHNPPKSAAELLAAFERQALVRAAARLGDALERL